MTQLRRRCIIGPLPSGNVALLTNLAKHAGLPWDVILASEPPHSHQPQPQAHLGRSALLDLASHEMVMCAAHNEDLRVVRALGIVDPADRMGA